MKKVKTASLALLLACAVSGNGCNDPRVHDTSKNPVAVKIIVDPEKPLYEIGDEVKLDYVVFDALGSPVYGIPASWQNPDPAGAEPLGGGRFRLLHVGAYTWRVTLDGYGLSDQVTLTVPSRPVEMEITVDPEKDHYVVGDEVEFGLLVYDQEGTLMDLPADWEAPDGSLARPEGGLRYTLLSEGRLTWTASLQPPWDLQASRTLLVDGTGPQVVIDSPERGDTIAVSASQPVMTVSGHVTDEPSGVDILYLRGNNVPEQQVTIEPDGSFILEVPVRQGMNTVELEAFDASGNATRLVRSAYVSTDFFSLEGDAAGRTHLPSSETVILSPEAFDRGSPSGNPPYDPCSEDASGNYTCQEITDLATVLELALNNVDFSSSQQGQHFIWPLVDQAWQFNLTDEIEVKATLDGNFTVDVGFTSLRAGLAKVSELSPVDGGLHSEIEYGPAGSGADTRPGIDASYGLRGTLTFNIWLDLTATDPVVQLSLCALAVNMCNPNPPNDCLSDYLLACNLPGQALPIVQAVSSIETPVLIGLSVDTMPATVDLDVGLDASNRPEASLRSLQVDLSNSTLDASALEDITINIGTIRFASFEVDLGTYQIPSTFVSDIADQLLDPLLNDLSAIIEGALGQLFACSDEQNPLCYVIPFVEEWLGSFAAAVVQQVQPAGASQAVEVDTAPAFESMQFDTSGATMVLGVRSDSEPSDQVLQHRDDDFLGQALIDGCLEGRQDYAGTPVQGQPVQVARRYDVLNSILLAAWRAAGFDIDLGLSDVELPEELRARSLELHARPWLPPAVTDCSSDDGTLVVQLGDLEVAGRLTTMAGEEIALHGFVSVQVPAELQLDTQDKPALSLDLAAAYARAEADTPVVDGNADPARAAAVQALLEHLGPQVARILLDAGVAADRATLPRSDISRFLGLSAGSAWWELMVGAVSAAFHHIVYDSAYGY